MRSILVLLLLAGVAAAQLPPVPDQLKQFDKFLGNWKGAGASTASPDGPQQDWTAVLTFKKIHGGFCVQRDMGLQLPDRNPYVFRALLWWDAETKRYRSFSIGNTGRVSIGEPVFTTDGKMVGTATRQEANHAVTDRWVVRVEGGILSYRIYRTIDGGDEFLYMSANFRKTDRAFSATRKGMPAMATPAEQMKALRPLAGSWRMKGKSSPMPGMPLEDTAGREDARAVLGGHVLFARVTGDETQGQPRYLADNYIVWDAAGNCYRSLWVSNYGEVTLERAYMLSPRRMVFLSTPAAGGVPQAIRSVVDFQKENEITVLAERLAKDGPAEKFFEAVFKRVEQ